MAHPIFTEEHDLIRAQLRRFVEEKVKPAGPKWEEAGFVPRAVLREMGGLGFFSLRVPEALGGAGLDARASVVLAEEVGRSTHRGFAITVLVHTDMASPHLIRFGTKRQLEKYLPGVMAGSSITAVGVSEPGAGSDVAAIRTRAIRYGDHYVLNGAKMFITNGVHAHVNRGTRFGPRLGEKPAIRQRLSRRLAGGEAARQLVHHTAWLDAQGTDCVAQVSMVKALAGDLVNQVLYDCVQFHGGMGFIRETAVERMSRDARVQAIGGGASEVMLEEIAKRFGAAIADGKPLSYA